MKTLSITTSILLVTSMAGFAQIFENSAITSSAFVTSSFISDDEGWLADNNEKLWHTTNGGQKWDSISIAKNFVKLDFTDALHGFALGSNAAYKTTDGGYSWSSLLLPGYIGKALYFLNNNTGFISGYQMIFLTTDGGETWSTVYTEDVSFLDFHFTGSTIGFAVANNDGDYKSIWKTADGGITWSNVFKESNYYMNAVWFLDENTGWAAGYYDEVGLGKEPTILKTTDGGSSWKENYRNLDVTGSGQSFIDIRFINELEGFTLSHFSLDVYTIDGGETWNLAHENGDLGLSPLFGIYESLDGYNDLYLVGKSGNVSIWK